MGAAIIIPAEFRELFDDQAVSTRKCIADEGSEFTPAESTEAHQLLEAIEGTAKGG